MSESGCRRPHQNNSRQCRAARHAARKGHHRRGRFPSQVQRRCCPGCRALPLPLRPLFALQDHHPEKERSCVRVLTGSTNFAITGICVNANHVLLFDRPNVARYYSDVFNNVWQVGKAAPFRTTDFSTKTKEFTAAGFPRTEITYSPHDDTRAATLLDEITTQIQKPSTKSVLFA